MPKKVRVPYHNCLSIHAVIQPMFALIWFKMTFVDHLTAVSGVGSSPALATCETSQVLLADVSSGFPGVLPFSPLLPIGSSRYE